MRTILSALVLAVCFLSACGPAAANHPAGDATDPLETKRMEIRHHTEAMQKIQDPTQLQIETQKHFLMTEELLGLMIERQKHAVAYTGAQPQGAAPMGGGMAMEGEDDAMEMAMPSTAPAGGRSPGAAQPQAPAAMGGGMAMEGDDAMEMAMPSAPSAGGMSPGAPHPQGPAAFGGGMKIEGEDAMEMAMPSTPPAGGMTPGAPPPQGAAPMGGGMMGGMMEGEDAMEMGGMGAATADPSATMAAPATAQRIAEREALLREIATHSTQLESITDPESRARETIKHQQMLDRLLGLMMAPPPPGCC